MNPLYNYLAGGIYMRIKVIIGVWILFFLSGVWAAVQIDPDKPLVYALVMSNGSKIKVEGYIINLEYKTVSFKSCASGLTATFPLNRISEVLRFSASAEEVPDDAAVMYRNETSLAQVKDDGGIPVVFKVTTNIVGSGGGSAARPGSKSFNSPNRSTGRGTKGSSNRNQSASSASSRNFGSSSSRSNASRSSKSSNSRSSSSRSNSSGSADDFFNAIFGGR